MTTREELYRLVDELPDYEIQAAMRYLQYLRDRYDPVLAVLLNAPEDDEPETAGERQTVDVAIEDLATGQMVISDQIFDDIS